MLVGTSVLSIKRERIKYMNEEIYGALKRIVEEVKEKRKAKCLNIDCVVNHQIGGNDIDLVETWLAKEESDEK